MNKKIKKTVGEFGIGKEESGNDIRFSIALERT